MKIAAYCRVSTDKEEQLDSLENQKLFFTEYATKNGYELARLYADEGISGTSLKKRTEFQRLLRDAKLGLFDMVVVKDISRFARNTVDFLQSIRTLKALGINTHFITANMESLGESEFVLTLFGALAQEESINLSKRVKFGKKINAQKGRVPQRIFGYNRIDTFTLEINPAEAKVVREIYRLYLEKGLGCRTISLELNRLGYKTKFGYDWDQTGVKRVLKNSIYCGRYVNNKSETIDCLEGKKAHIPLEERFHHDRPEWAIISPEVFDQTQEMLEYRRNIYKNDKPYSEGTFSTRHVFSTLIKCEHCGSSFYQKHYTRKSTRYYWKCRTNDQYTARHCPNNITINEDELINEIRLYLTALIEDKDAFIKSVLSEIEKRNQEKNDSFNQVDVQRKIRLLIAKKTKYQEMYLADVITLTDLKEKTKMIESDLQGLNFNLAQHEQAAALEKDKTSFIEKYTEEIHRFLNLESITNLDMRKFIDHISVDQGGTVKIHLKHLSEQL